MYMCDARLAEGAFRTGEPVGGNLRTAGTIISCTGLTSSHASKVIRSVEDKGLLARKLGEQDKRQMYFTLTRKGKACLENIKEQGVEVPEWLAPLFFR